jgi:hypothetical protein
MLSVHLTAGSVNDTTELERVLAGIRVPRVGSGAGPRPSDLCVRSRPRGAYIPAACLGNRRRIVVRCIRFRRVGLIDSHHPPTIVRGDHEELVSRHSSRS